MYIDIYICLLYFSKKCMYCHILCILISYWLNLSHCFVHCLHSLYICMFFYKQHIISCGFAFNILLLTMYWVFWDNMFMLTILKVVRAHTVVSMSVFPRVIANCRHCPPDGGVSLLMLMAALTCCCWTSCSPLKAPQSSKLSVVTSV